MKWRQKMTLTITSIEIIQQNKIKEQKISLFGYGSLMNPESAAKTLKYRPKPISTVIKGLERAYNATQPVYYEHLKEYKNTAFLDVQPNPKNVINGVILEINHNDLARLIIREKNYQLSRIETQEKITFYTFMTPQEHHPHNYENPVVSQYYIDIVEHKLEQIYGVEFLQTYKKTTNPTNLPIIEGAFLLDKTRHNPHSQNHTNL